MRPPAERRRLRVAAAYGVFAGGLALVSLPVYLSVAPSWRPGVIRVAVSLVVGVGLVHVVRTLRAAVAAQPRSDFERALRTTVPEPHFDPFFVRLSDEIRHSTRSPRYFEQVLWPRLVALGAERDGRTGRRFPLVGPSLATIRELIATVERRA